MEDSVEGLTPYGKVRGSWGHMVGGAMTRLDILIG